MVFTAELSLGLRGRQVELPVFCYGSVSLVIQYLEVGAARVNAWQLAMAWRLVHGDSHYSSQKRLIHRGQNEDKEQFGVVAQVSLPHCESHGYLLQAASSMTVRQPRLWTTASVRKVVLPYQGFQNLMATHCKPLVQTLAHSNSP